MPESAPFRLANGIPIHCLPVALANAGLCRYMALPVMIPPRVCAVPPAATLSVMLSCRAGLSSSTTVPEIVSPPTLSVRVAAAEEMPAACLAALSTACCAVTGAGPAEQAAARTAQAARMTAVASRRARCLPR